VRSGCDCPLERCLQTHGMSRLTAAADARSVQNDKVSLRHDPDGKPRQVELPDGRLLASRRPAGTRATDGAAWTVWLFVGLEALRRRDQAPLSRLTCPGSVVRRCPQRIARQATRTTPFARSTSSTSGTSHSSASRSAGRRPPNYRTGARTNTEPALAGTRRVGPAPLGNASRAAQPVASSDSASRWRCQTR